MQELRTKIFCVLGSPNLGIEYALSPKNTDDIFMHTHFHKIVISHPSYLPDESDMVIWLFENGMDRFHLRKPNSSKRELETMLKEIPSEFHSRISVHYHPIRQNVGFHFKHDNLEIASNEISNSYSAHSFSEIDNLKNRFDYFFLSPIFDSISKEGYTSAFDENELTAYLKKSSENIVALGGVDASNVAKCEKMGFAGIALLGTIWKPFQGGDIGKAKQIWMKIVNN